MSEAEPVTAARKRRRWWRSPKTWVIGGAAVVLLIAVGIGSGFLFSPQRPATAVRTQTVEVTRATQTATVSFDGTLSPRRQANLNFAVAGEVTKVSAKVGQKVTKGQALATIDGASLADAVDLAEANLAAAEATYDDVSGSGTSAAITAAAAQVDAAKASLSGAKENLRSATLRASIAGTVASIDLSVGDQVSGSGSGSGSSGSGPASGSNSASASSAQIVVISTATWKLEGSVGASDLSRLKAGQPAKVTAASGEIDGTVASVGIVATSTSDGTATFPVVINLSGTHTALYSGTTASATVTTGSYADVLTVATAAITSQSGATVVDKVSSGGSTVTTVQVGRVFGDLTEITSGLSEGDRVVVSYRPSGAATASRGEAGIGGGFGDLGGGPPAGGGNGGGPSR